MFVAYWRLLKEPDYDGFFGEIQTVTMFIPSTADSLWHIPGTEWPND